MIDWSQTKCIMRNFKIFFGSPFSLPSKQMTFYGFVIKKITFSSEILTIKAILKSQMQ